MVSRQSATPPSLQLNMTACKSCRGPGGLLLLPSVLAMSACSAAHMALLRSMQARSCSTPPAAPCGRSSHTSTCSDPSQDNMCTDSVCSHSHRLYMMHSNLPITILQPTLPEDQGHQHPCTCTNVNDIAHVFSLQGDNVPHRLRGNCQQACGHPHPTTPHPRVCSHKPTITANTAHTHPKQVSAAAPGILHFVCTSFDAAIKQQTPVARSAMAPLPS